MNGFSGFEHPDQGALTEEELLAALEENRAFEAQQTEQPGRTGYRPRGPRRRSSSLHLRQGRTGLPRRKAESIRRKRNPARRRSPPKHPRSRQNSPVEPLLASVWQGKMIYSADHVPVKVDFSALGFGEKE